MHFSVLRSSAKPFFRQFRFGAADGVRQDGDMSVRTDLGVLHHLDAAACEKRCGHLPDVKAKSRAERLAQRERFLRICRVHADMAERKAEDDGARRLAALGDSLEAARRDIARRAELAAADCLHERRFDIIRKIFVADTSAGQELDALKHLRERGQRLHAAERLRGGKNLTMRTPCTVAAIISLGVTQPGMTGIPRSSHHATIFSL